MINKLYEQIVSFKNIVEIEKRGHLPSFSKGKFRVELYPDEFNDILRAIEIYKFGVDKSLFFECNHESLRAKSFDLEFLFEYLFCIYTSHIKEIEESESAGKGESKKGSKKIYNIAQNQS